ncbi:uncharacterized protein LOC119658278 [Hermetia illucens]|uniref:uncharacterized protein LOC119658278 n=1 Tax=Hermetia illucens TaxID=343691 RepID=UPI0018CC32EF|nr:uncharacterized protein LOC119658278 [Hermetia illucens]
MSTRREKPCRLTTHQDSSTDFPGDTFKSFERDLILKEKSADNSLLFNNDRSFETIQGFGKAADHTTDYSFLHQDPFTPIRNSFPTNNSFFNQSLNEPSNTIGISESETRPIYFLDNGKEYHKPYLDNDSLFHQNFNFSDPGQLRANMKRKRYFRSSPPSSPIRMDFSFEIRHQKLIRSTDQLIKSIERDLMKPLHFKYNPRNDF